MLALSVLLTPRAGGSDWQGGIRLQSSGGHDSNVLEQLEKPRRVAGDFMRLLGDGRVARTGLPLKLRAELSGRVLYEEYSRYSSENRLQEEIRVTLEATGLRRGTRGRFEAGFGGRQYPDSTARDHRRGWARLSVGFPLGPRGTLEPRAEIWYLDFRSTARRDETGFDFDLSYRQPLHSLLHAQTGMEVGTVGHGLPSIQVVNPEPDLLEWVLGPDRHDTFRRAHIGFLWRWQGLIQIEYGYRSQSSNSVDAALSRHELSWLWSRALPLGLTGQFFGTLEHTRYTDARLDSLEVFRVGDPEAGDDDNAVVVRLGRTFGRWTVEARHAWYRNESLLVENYYRKRVWSVGLSWESGQLSGF